MQPTVLLIGSTHQDLIGVQEMLSERQGMRVVGEVTYGAHTVPEAARLRPDVIILATDMIDQPLVPLVGDLHMASPESKAIVIRERMTLESEMLRVLTDFGVCGYLAREGLRPDAVLRCVTAVHEDDVLVISRALLEEWYAVLERRERPRVEGLVLTPREREDVTALTAGQVHRRLRATLWQENSDLKEILHALCELAGIDLNMVATEEALLKAETQAHPGDFLIIDCSLALADDMARCAAIVTRTTMPVHIIHPRAKVVRALQKMARGEVIRFAPKLVGLPLLEQLRLLKAMPTAPTPRSHESSALQAASEPLPFSHRELEVLRLIAEGFRYKEIAARLGIGLSTVKSYVAEMKGKSGLSTRQELITAYHRSAGS